MNNFEIGDNVWVKCANSDAWVAGVVTGFSAKRIKVYNEVRGIEAYYSIKNVEAA